MNAFRVNRRDYVRTPERRPWGGCWVAAELAVLIGSIGRLVNRNFGFRSVIITEWRKSWLFGRIIGGD